MKCTTPGCHREAKLSFEGINTFYLETESVPVCIPCMKAVEEGSGHSPNEVGWSILDSVGMGDVEKIREVLI